MKLLEKDFTYQELKTLCSRKNWKMITTDDLENISPSFINSILADKAKILVWLGNESSEVEKGIFTASIVGIERVGNNFSMEIIEDINCLFLYRGIVIK